MPASTLINESNHNRSKTGLAGKVQKSNALLLGKGNSHSTGALHQTCHRNVKAKKQAVQAGLTLFMTT